MQKVTYIISFVIHFVFSFYRLHEQASSAHHGHAHALDTAAYSSYPTMAGKILFFIAIINYSLPKKKNTTILPNPLFWRLIAPQSRWYLCDYETMERGQGNVERFPSFNLPLNFQLVGT